MIELPLKNFRGLISVKRKEPNATELARLHEIAAFGGIRGVLRT
jgi:hypothetical protein